MKSLKMAAAALLAAIVCIPAAGCSGDKSWAMKDSSTSIPIGCYIFNLYASYEQADSKKSDSKKSVLDQKIENKDAKSWIRDKAVSSTREILCADKKMKDMKLTLSSTEKQTASQMSSTAWNQISSHMEKYGVAQSSFELAYGDLYMKEKKIFDATYGKGGTKAVSDDELKNYYTKNYTDFDYIICPLYKANSNGQNASPFTDAQKKQAESVFNGYAAQIKSGKMTMRTAADAYKAAQKSSSDVLHSDSVNFLTDTTYPDSIKNALKSMKSGETKTVDVKEYQAYMLVSKNDTAKGTASKMNSSSGRENLLLSYKYEEFYNAFQKEAGSMSGVTLNSSALNSYDPKMFVSASSSASPTT